MINFIKKAATRTAICLFIFLFMINVTAAHTGGSVAVDTAALADSGVKVVTAANADSGDMSLTYSNSSALSIIATLAGMRNFSDVPAGAWYYNDVYAAVRQGLIYGKSETIFAPDDPVTLAETVTLAVRQRQKLTEEEAAVAPGNPWYAPYMEYANEHFLGGAEPFHWDDRTANEPITRGFFAYIFYKMLPEDELTLINSVDDGAIPDVPISHVYGEAVYAMYRAGVLAGSGEARAFLPDTGIKRAEAAAILARITNSSPRIVFGEAMTGVNGSVGGGAGGASGGATGDGGAAGGTGSTDSGGTRSGGATGGAGSRAGIEIINNGGLYVKYGSVYYRQYGAGSFSKSGIFNNFYPMPGAKSKIMRLNNDGTSDMLFDDDGTGPIYIYRDADQSREPLFILTRIKSGGADRDYNEIYGVTFDGRVTDIKLTGNIVAVDGRRSLIIAQKNEGAIFAYDMRTQKTTRLTGDNFWPVYYDEKDGVLYIYEQTEDLYDYDAVRGDDYFNVAAYNVENAKKTVLFSASEETVTSYMGEWHYPGQYYEFQNSSTDDKNFYVNIVQYGGTAYMLNGEVRVVIAKDGSSHRYMSEMSEPDWFGVQKPFTYRSDSPFYKDTPGYYVYESAGARAPRLVLNDADLAAAGLPSGVYYGDDDFGALQNIEYVDGRVFFTVTTGIRNYDEDIGWRTGYDRVKSRVYVKDLTTGKITQIYSY